MICTENGGNGCTAAKLTVKTEATSRHLCLHLEKWNTETDLSGLTGGVEWVGNLGYRFFTHTGAVVADTDLKS